VHAPSGRWLFGLGLTSITVLLWGTLPFLLKDLLRVLDPFTLSGVRLFSAGVVLALFLLARRRLPLPGSLGGRGRALLAGAAGGLGANYALYVIGLRELTPGTAQLLIQLAPILLLLGSLLVFGERLSRLQAGGAALLVAGFCAFFNEHVGELFAGGSSYGRGVFFIVLAAVTWAGYGLAQKQLLAVWSSVAVMAWVDLGAGLVLAPFSQPSALLSLSPAHQALLAASALNTLVAYGAFAEALAHWEASKVSATLATAPIVTFAVAPWVARVFPGAAPPEEHNALAYAGAALVVLGSMLVALAPALRTSGNSVNERGHSQTGERRSA
jgi:drug/metabolite transporter (DMT)-like permease